MQRLYRRSIVWDYFVAGRKFFAMLPISTTPLEGSRIPVTPAGEQRG
jgi:hypothetical protein